MVHCVYVSNVKFSHVQYRFSNNKHLKFSPYDMLIFTGFQHCQMVRDSLLWDAEIDGPSFTLTLLQSL